MQCVTFVGSWSKNKERVMKDIIETTWEIKIQTVYYSVVPMLGFLISITTLCLCRQMSLALRDVQYI